MKKIVILYFFFVGLLCLLTNYYNVDLKYKLSDSIETLTTLPAPPIFPIRDIKDNVYNLGNIFTTEINDISLSTIKDFLLAPFKILILIISYPIQCLVWILGAIFFVFITIIDAIWPTFTELSSTHTFKYGGIII